MRAALLGTTAVAVVASLAGIARAEGLELSVGGRYLATAGGTIGEEADFGPAEEDTRDVVFKQDVEVYFLGETTLDNGLTVGARIELEGQTSANDQIDSVYAYFSGGFGEIRFGDTFEALSQLCFTVPSASDMFGADSPMFSFSNAGIRGYGGTNGTCYGIDDKSTKIVYFSPNFSGFQFAVSFAPDDTEDTRNTVEDEDAGTRFDNDVNQLSETLSIAATYTREFNGIALAVGGGASFSFDRETPFASADDRGEYNAYARIGYAGFTFGGAYSFRDNVSNFSDLDSEVYGVGLTYDWSRYSVGLGWTHGRYELSPFSGIQDTHDVIALTGSMLLAPGVSIDGVLGYSDYDADFRIDDYRTVEIGVGTSITF